nr:hypothetical protein [Tanacetum cinerariifolium]
MNGKVNWFDEVDSDEFSIHELREMLKLLGYKNERMFYHFKILNNGLDLGLKPLVLDSDVINMFKQLGSMKVIKVYIEVWLSAIDYESVSKPAKMSTIDTDLPKSMSNPLPMRKKGVASKLKRSIDIAKITKKWPKPDKNEQEIVKSAQKPDPKKFLCTKENQKTGRIKGCDWRIRVSGDSKKHNQAREIALKAM